MTLAEFQATRRWCDDIPTAIGSADWSEYGRRVSGQIYVFDFYIEAADNIEGATGPYLLTLGREQYFGELEALEAVLYDWAKREDYFGAAA